MEVEEYSLQISCARREGARSSGVLQIDFGPGLAPGVYTRIVQWTIHYPCVVTNGTSYAVYGYGEGGNVYADSGTPGNGE